MQKYKEYATGKEQLFLYIFMLNETPPRVSFKEVSDVSVHTRALSSPPVQPVLLFTQPGVHTYILHVCHEYISCIC